MFPKKKFQILDDLEIFVKQTNDIQNNWIEDNFEQIAESNLLYLPDEAIQSSLLLSRNIELRLEMGMIFFSQLKNHN